jgi:hypothetical protein
MRGFLGGVRNRLSADRCGLDLSPFSARAAFFNDLHLVARESSRPPYV